MRKPLRERSPIAGKLLDSMSFALLALVAVEHTEACTWPGFLTAERVKDAKETKTARA
jgi:hypothetical protein